jgi:TetR/AcrR family transcriptional repressor of nem operon
MPREKDFKQADVLKKCAHLFASHGYSATGIQQIVDKTGINRSSLYATFKGKDALFLTCLQNAMAEDVAVLEGFVKKDYSAVKLTEAYLDVIVKDLPGYHLLKFANAEFKLLNKKTQTLLNAHYTWKFNFFEGLFKTAQKSGKLTKKISAHQMAALLELVVLGVQQVSPLTAADKVYKQAALEFTELIQKKNK